MNENCFVTALNKWDDLVETGLLIFVVEHI